MMNRILKLKEERANLTVQIRGILDEGVEHDKIDEVKKLEKRADELSEKILIEERQLERERATGEREEKREEKKDKDVEVREAFVNYLRTGSDQAMREYRDLQLDNPTQAGYLVPQQQFVNELIKELDNQFVIRGLCKILPPLKGSHSLGYPKRNARANTAVFGTELQAPTKDTALAFGLREFRTNPAIGEIVLSKTLMRNLPGIENLVRQELAYNFGELLEQKYIDGDGNGCPLGLFTPHADGISVARDVSAGNTTGEVKYDNLLNCKYALKPQYQNNLKFLFHRDIVKQIIKLKDGDGNYIYQPNVQIGGVDRLFGIEVIMSEYAPNVATTGKYVGLLGDFTGYWILDSLNLEIIALNELYARQNQCSIICRLETDGAPVIEEKFIRIKLA